MVDLHRLPDNSASVPSRLLSVEGASEADARAPKLSWVVVKIMVTFWVP